MSYKCCKPRVLIVDDNQFNIFALRETIDSHFEAEIEEAENGQVALDLINHDLTKQCDCK